MIELPVADPWFVRDRVDDSITLVTEPHVHPLLRCNVWHVRGRDRDVVIDTALGLAPLRHLVERELDGPLLAVATHAHGDHVGGLHEFDQRAIHWAEAVYDGPLLDELDGSDIDAYVATMRRLRDLPVTVVHGGHEPSFGRDRLVEICATYLASHT